MTDLNIYEIEVTATDAQGNRHTSHGEFKTTLPVDKASRDVLDYVKSHAGSDRMRIIESDK